MGLVCTDLVVEFTAPRSRTVSKLRCVVVAGCLAVTVPAQLTLTDGNVVYATANPSQVSQQPRPFDLVGDPLQVDHGFEHWWYYRVGSDTREFALRDVGGLVGGVLPGGGHGDRDFADVDGRGLLKASLDFDVFASGPASGLVITRLTMTNVSGGPLDLDVFSYADLDIAGSAGNDVCVGDGQRHFVSDGSGVSIEVRGVDAARSTVGAYPAVRSLLIDGAIDDLDNTLPPLNGDYTGAFQWTRTMQPFEQRTFTVLFAINNPALTPPVVAHYGAGNGGDFEVFASEQPVQDLTQPRVFGVRMKHAAPFREYRIVTGLDPWQPQPFITGIDLWVLPASIVAVYPGFTNAAGRASVAYVVPNSAYLNGISLYHQCFYVDGGAPNGFAYSTAGMRTTIGRF